MRRIIPIVLAAVLLLCCAGGCGSAPDPDKLNIVCTTFSLYDWMRCITAGVENVELRFIADNGVDMHSYQPTTGDIVDIATCDMFVGIGGESEEWVDEVLDSSGSDKTLVVTLLDAMGESVLENSADHHHEEGHDHHGHECVPDEHIWLSPLRAIELCGYLTERLCGLDQANAELYTANSDSYIAKLTELDRQYREAVESADKDTLLFADRFPFRYLVNDYGIEYYAAFDGCSAETEASFETIAELSQAIDRHGLGSVLVIEGSDESLARTVIDGSQTGGQSILTVDSIQSVTSEDIANGATYLGIMKSNLEVIKEALGG